MTDRERLEEIKNSYLQGIHISFGTSWVLMPKKNSDWLIQQAERVQELELEIKELLYSTISENKRYKQALEFYADESRYEAEHGGFWNIILDGGKTAREALGVDKFETRQNRND